MQDQTSSEPAALPPPPADARHGITDNPQALLATLPLPLRQAVEHEGDFAHLLEIGLDLGRTPWVRYHDRELPLRAQEITHEQLETVAQRLGEFGDDNRAGIARTLHRISCIRNRRGDIVGLTMRVGRAVFGTSAVIEDFVLSGQSILLLGRPGVGKTTMLREVARVLAESGKRVIIVDTSNEIAGDGDIPHAGIGRARRMQVPTPALQHAVMVEAVENHMPEVIVIDEIGTELEALAARTIAERGVQLVATAHGNSLTNLMLNPTLADLVGGIQTVTLSDEEARRRRTRKSVLERKAPPTFNILVELQSFTSVALHDDVAATVDTLLRGDMVTPQIRELGDDGAVQHHEGTQTRATLPYQEPRGREFSAANIGGTEFTGSRDLGNTRDRLTDGPQPLGGLHKRLYPFGVSPIRLAEAIREAGANASIVKRVEDADAMMTLRTIFRRRPAPIRDAEMRGLPIYVLKHNSLLQMEQSLRALGRGQKEHDPVTAALSEAEEAIDRLTTGDERAVELTPQNAYLRRLQHQFAQRYDVFSSSKGREPHRRVRLFKS